MSVSTTTSTITYQGNGSTTVFTFPFIYVSSSDIVVNFTDTDGTITLLDPSQYTLSLNAAAPGALWGIGGSVTYPKVGSGIASGTYITISRDVPYTQTTTITNQGTFYPQVIEQALDTLCLLIQQVQTQVSYCIQCPIEDATAPTTLPVAAERANKTLEFDNSGQPIVG